MRLLSVDVITPAAALPVSVDEFIDHARLNGVTVNREPVLITRELTAATQRAELYLRRSLITQTVAAVYAYNAQRCSCGESMMLLPRGRVQSVASVSSQGAPLDAGAWRYDGWNVVELLGYVSTAATAVEWISGYGDDGAAVPEPIREGIYEYATMLHATRDGNKESKYATGAQRGLPLLVVDLWRPFQIELSG